MYQEESGEKVNGTFHRNLLMAQCQLTSLMLEQGKVADAADALHRCRLGGEKSLTDRWRIFLDFVHFRKFGARFLLGVTFWVKIPGSTKLSKVP